MKIEIEIEDVRRDEVIAAMADQLLTSWSSDDAGHAHSRRSALGEALGRAVKAKIDEVARELVRQGFDDVVHERIAAAVDAVIAEGWHETDSFGGRRGEKLDLRARISRTLTEQRGDGYPRKPDLVKERIDEAIKNVLNDEFRDVVARAKQDLRDRLDVTVTQKVAEVIKAAMGLR